MALYYIILGSISVCSAKINTIFNGLLNLTRNVFSNNVISYYIIQI